ncbi:MAG: hypothetical protein FWH17_04330 [Oscillospiraceae bacterium]|nr:hypothetical protein [Oscillospiraceae bacterium]
MKLILIEDSFNAIELIVELITNRIEGDNMLEKLFVYPSPGLAFNENDYTKLKESDGKNSRINFYEYKDAVNFEEFKDNLFELIDSLKEGVRVAMDLEILNDSGEQYEKFNSRKLAKEMVDSGLLNYSDIVFYSSCCDTACFEALTPRFAFYLRPDSFEDAAAGSDFYDFLIGRVVK